MKRKLTLFFLLLPFLLCYGQSNMESLPTCSPKGSLSARSNLVTWVALIPSLGLEYKANDHLGLLLDGAYSHWKLDMDNPYWNFWNISPQVRYYFGKAKYNYIGAQYSMGEYNFTGNQGKYMGGGLTLGHQFYAAKNLMVDLGLSLGYFHLYDKEEYTHINGHNYRNGNKTSHGYWGPTSLSMTLVWKIN